MAEVKLSVRELVEFLLRTGSIDSRFAGFDRANEGARSHRKLQKAAGEGYQAEVFLSETREVDGIPFTWVLAYRIKIRRKRMDILTIGEVLIDLTQTGKDARGIPQFAANPGGAPANLARCV